MGFTTLGGYAADSTVDANGIKAFAAQTILPASDLTDSYLDTQGVAVYGLLPGIIAGGVCTAASLTLTIPSGTVFLARTIWVANASVTVALNDNTTVYIWACSDGEMRTTASAFTLPTGYDARSCCLMCKVTTASGVATVDITVQQKARASDPTGRMVSENNPCIAPVADTIPSTATAVIPTGSQLQVFDTLTINGVLTINGKLRVS